MRHGASGGAQSVKHVPRVTFWVVHRHVNAAAHGACVQCNTVCCTDCINACGVPRIESLRQCIANMYSTIQCRCVWCVCGTRRVPRQSDAHMERSTVGVRAVDECSHTVRVACSGAVARAGVQWRPRHHKYEDTHRGVPCDTPSCHAVVLRLHVRAMIVTRGQRVQQCVCCCINEHEIAERRHVPRGTRSHHRHDIQCGAALGTARDWIAARSTTHVNDTITERRTAGTRARVSHMYEMSRAAIAVHTVDCMRTCGIKTVTASITERHALGDNAAYACHCTPYIHGACHTTLVETDARQLDYRSRIQRSANHVSTV